MDDLLIYSSEIGDLNLVKLAIKNKADIHVDDDEALKLANLYDHLEVV